MSVWVFVMTFKEADRGEVCFASVAWPTGLLVVDSFPAGERLRRASAGSAT